MMRSGLIPRRIHQIASCDNPPTASVENGGPLSVRIASGTPNSRKVASNERFTGEHVVLRSALHVSR